MDFLAVEDLPYYYIKRIGWVCKTENVFLLIYSFAFLLASLSFEYCYLPFRCTLRTTEKIDDTKSMRNNDKSILHFTSGLPGIAMFITWLINKLINFESYMS